MITIDLMQIIKPPQSVGKSVAVGVFATHLEWYMSSFVAIVFLIGL